MGKCAKLSPAVGKRRTTEQNRILRSPVYCLLPTAFCPQLFNFLILSTTGGWE